MCVRERESKEACLDVGLGYLISLRKKGKVGTNRKNEVLIDVISLSMIHCGEIYLFFHFPIYLFLFRGYKMEEG